MLGVYNIADYGAVINGSTDDSTAVQAAINAAAAAGGGVVYFPPGVCIAKGLSWPNNVTLVGCGKQVSILKLRNNANTYLIASSSYVLNQLNVNLNQIAYNMTFDGNKQNQSTWKDLIVSKCFRGKFNNIQGVNSKGSGLLFTVKNANGSEGNQGTAESSAEFCDFTDNDGAGIFGQNNSLHRLADIFVTNCNLAFNGKNSTLKNVHFERSAGMKILNNQMYGTPGGNLTLLLAGLINVVGNAFDNSDGQGANKNVYIEMAGYGQMACTGNYFWDVRSSVPGQVCHLFLKNAGVSYLSAIVDGNSFGYVNLSGPNAQHIIQTGFNPAITIGTNSYRP